MNRISPPLGSTLDFAQTKPFILTSFLNSSTPSLGNVDPSIIHKDSTYQGHQRAHGQVTNQVHTSSLSKDRHVFEITQCSSQVQSINA
jgi:hypothetical protein